MPYGSISAYRETMRELMLMKPKTVLDLGIGYGINGAGVKNWIDDVKMVVGVEAFTDYKNPMWGCYDMIHPSTIQYYLENSSLTFDAIVMTDVIEHFDKEEGFEVIEKCKKRLNEGGKFIISTPGVFIEQGAAYGNEFETHRSLWNVSDFNGFRIVKDGTLDDILHQMIVAVWE